jgi:PAS domain S-box-containing protein
MNADSRQPSGSPTGSSTVELRFQAMIERSQDGITLVSAEGIQTYVSPAVARLSGFRSDELVGTSIFPLIHPDDAPRLREWLQHLMTRPGGTETNVARVRHKNGSWRWLESVATNLLADPAIEAIVINFRDVTARQEAAAELRTTKERLDFLLSATPAMLYACTVTQPPRVTFVSRNLVNLLGYAPAEALADPGFWQCHAHPEDLAQGSAKLAELFKQDQVASEYRFRHKNGTWRWVEDHMRVIRDVQGQPVEVVGYVKDITDRKQAEEALRQAYDKLEVCVQERTTELEAAVAARRESEELLRAFYDSPGVLRGIVQLLDDDILVVSTNEAQAVVYGRTPEGMRHLRASDLGVERAVIDLWLDHLRQSQRRGTPVTFEYSSHFRLAGSWGVATVSPLILPDDRRSLFGYVAFDITERKRAELMKEALLLLGTELGSARTPVQAARSILASADKLWKWDSATLDLYAAESDRLVPVINCDVVDGERREVPSPRPPGAPSPRMRRIMQRGPELILRAQPVTPPADSFMVGDVSRPSASIMCVPLRRQGQVVGVLSIQSYTPDAYTAEDLRTLQALADHCGGALERIQAGAALQESEARVRQSEDRLRMALEAAGMVTWEWDVAAGTIRYSENAPAVACGEDLAPYCSVDGLMRELHPDDRERLAQALHETLSENRPFECEYRVHMLDGSYRWILGRGKIVAAEGSRPTQVMGISLDITERKRTEQALRKAHDELERAVRERTVELESANVALRLRESEVRALVENSEDFIVRLDREARQIYSNPATARLYGVPLNDVLGKSLREMGFPEEVWRPARKACDRVFDSRREVTVELAHPFGATLRCLEARHVPEFAPDGSVASVLVVSRDITERKRTEEALRVSEQRATAVLNAITESILFTDTGGKIIALNSEMARRFGRTAGELLGKSPYDLLPSELAESRTSQIKEVVRSGKPVRFVDERAGRILDNHYFPMLDSDGSVMGVVVFSVDVTERKRAEAQLSLQAMLLDQIRDTVTATDLEGRITYVNDAQCRALGRSRQELLGQSVTVFGEGPEGGVTQQHIIEATRTQGEWRGEIVNRDREGREFVVDCRTILVRDDEGRPVGMCGTATDISERKQAERKLRASESLLRATFENAPFEFWARDKNEVCILQNAALRDHWGDLLGRRPQDAGVSPEALAIWRANNRRAFAGEVVKGEIELHEASGRRWMYNMIAPFRVDGEIQGILGLNIDITQRKRAEQALRESEQRYQTLAAATFEGIAITEDARFVDANEQLLKMLGYTHDELVGMEVAAAVAPEHHERVLVNIRAGRESHVEHDMVRKGGSRLSVEAHGRTVTSHGRPVRFTAIRDITERKRAEEALRNSEEKYRKLVDTTDTGYVIVDSGGCVLDANQRYVEMAGHQNLEEILGRSVLEWTDPADVEKNRQAVRLCGEQGFTRNFEVGYVDRAGKVTPIEINATVVTEDSGPRILALCRDITKRKRAEQTIRESEQRYRSIVEGAQEGIWLIDARWRLTFVNARLTEMFGYLPGEMLGHPIVEFMDDEERAVAPEKMRARERGARATHEAKFRRKNGSELWALVSGNPLLDEQGQFAGALALITDITERKHSERVLQRYADALRTLSRRLLDVQEVERRALARELHDEVGQNLTTLKLALDRCLQGGDGPNHVALEHARTILLDLVSRVRNLSLDLRPSMLDDLGLMPALLWQFEHYTMQTHIQVRFTQSGLVDRRFGQHVETAAYRIVQEALTNVARHADVSEVFVRVNVGDRLLRVQIQDHGRGFDPAAAQAAANSSGLRGMQERASLLGGELQINSDPGAGTFVLAELPFQTADTPPGTP